jgi:hypothetical protein
MTKSEQLVYDRSRNSFLSLWSYANPLNNEGKELCDILVVCDPDIIIISVKEIEYKDTGKPEVDFERWRRKAINESCKQIYGAERRIDLQPNVITHEGKITLPFPRKDTRNIYRIAVALGSKEKIPMTFGDFGKGFVHVFDEKSLQALFSELDTISDFLKYLSDKEEWLKSGKVALFTGEEDLLAFYLNQDSKFLSEPSLVVLDEGLWNGLLQMPETVSKKKTNETSYIWDNILERIYENFSSDNYRTAWAPETKTLSDIEQAVRVMAKENRQMRRFLGDSILALLNHTSLGARIFDVTESPIRYVFMTANYDRNREINFKELQARCLVARGLNHSKQTVIGILIERSPNHTGDTVSICYIDVPNWTQEWQEKMDIYQNELGFFLNLKRKSAE